MGCAARRGTDAGIIAGAGNVVDRVMVALSCRVCVSIHTCTEKSEISAEELADRISAGAASAESFSGGASSAIVAVRPNPARGAHS